MIKYPLYVTLDTNIFDSNKLDFSKDSTLGLLVNYIEAKKIKLVLSNIVIKEVEKHVLRASKDVCSQFRELRKDILNVAAEPFLEQIGISPSLLLLDKKQYKEKGMTVWREFLENLQPEIMDMSLVDIDSIVNDYFEIKPPFEVGEKKRKEFPDAFIANQIRKRFGVDEVIAIVSNDNGLKKACGNSSNHIFYESLADLYDAINRQEAEYKEVLQKINSLLVGYISEIRDIVKNEDCIEVHGISYDKDGIESGFDYSDVEVKDIEDIKCHVRTIDEITDQISWATLLCTANIEVECSYEDYNNAVWDSETKSYYFLETRKNIEIHSARFGLRIEYNRIEEKLRIIPFKVILGGDTLEERFEKNEEDEEYYDEMDIINQERENLGMCSLDKYADYLEEDLVDSRFLNDVIIMFEEINKKYREYEDIVVVYDECSSIIKDTESGDIVKNLVIALKDVKGFPIPCDINTITSEEKDAIILWIDESGERLYKFSKQKALPDTFGYGEVIEIHDGEEVYQFYIGEFSGIAIAGDQETIDIYIKDKSGEIIAKGDIKLTVGYIDFDEDGGAGNGIEDEIEYSYERIIEILECIVESMKQHIENKWKIAKKIESVMLEEH